MRHRRSITLKRGNALLDPSPSPSRARQARRRPAGPRRRMMTRTLSGKRNRAPPLPDGALSDTVNLSRAKDAAAALVLAGLNETEESGTGRPRMRVRQFALPHSGPWPKGRSAGRVQARSPAGATDESPPVLARAVR